MNWSAFAAVVSCLGLLATPITAAYYYGRIAAKVDATEQKTNAHEVQLTKHERQLGELDGWRLAMRESR